MKNISSKKLTQAIDGLPEQVFPELANFIESLRFKVSSPHYGKEANAQIHNSTLIHQHFDFKNKIKNPVRCRVGRNEVETHHFSYGGLSSYD
jgi:hypothetical protein